MACPVGAWWWFNGVLNYVFINVNILLSFLLLFYMLITDLNHFVNSCLYYYTLFCI